jgi:uroporphyrinogen decarboxylase
MSKINQGKERIEKAVRREKTDRTPICLSGDFVFFHYAERSATAADYVNKFPWALDRALDALKQMKHIDAVSVLGITPGKALGAVWMSKTKLPGHELPPTASWQIEEVACMKVEDYDVIIDKGWKYYQKYYFEHYLGLTEEDLLMSGKYMAYTDQKLQEIGCINMTQMMGPIIYDGLCAGRGIVNFTRDLWKIPDKVKATLDVITEEMMADFRRDLAALQKRCPGESIRVGIAPAVRGNCDFISRDKFEQYVWPLFQAEANAVLEIGGTPYFHMDANWTKVLDYFNEFPANRCIFDSDGMTDIYKIKEILGDRMCITGNISAALMSLGTPDQVYKEAKTQIADFGPTGFIASGSCTLPHNTKPENIDAIIAACLE